MCTSKLQKKVTKSEVLEFLTSDSYIICHDLGNKKYNPRSGVEHLRETSNETSTRKTFISVVYYSWAKRKRKRERKKESIYIVPIIGQKPFLHTAISSFFLSSQQLSDYIQPYVSSLKYHDYLFRNLFLLITQLKCFKFEH